jgi:protein TonB
MRLSRAEAGRWSASFGAVLAVHLSAAAALLAWRIPHDPPASVPAVLLDLTPSENPPAPQQEASTPQQASDPPAIDTETLARLLPEPEVPAPPILPQPDRLAEALPPPDIPPEVVIATTPPPPPPAKPAPRKPAPAPKPTAVAPSIPAAPTAQPATAPPSASAPPASVASQPSPDVLQRWQTTLLAHLQRHKRYPGLARNNNEQGIVYLRFTMNRSGAVIVKAIERGSGHASLDTETLALIDRAQPLPPPPPGIPGERFEFVVPVQFQLR